MCTVLCPGMYVAQVTMRFFFSRSLINCYTSPSMCHKVNTQVLQRAAVDESLHLHLSPARKIYHYQRNVPHTYIYFIYPQNF